MTICRISVPIVIYYTYMFVIVKIRFKFLFYTRIRAKNKAQLRDCFVMHLLYRGPFYVIVRNSQWRAIVT